MTSNDIGMIHRHGRNLMQEKDCLNYNTMFFIIRLVIPHVLLCGELQKLHEVNMVRGKVMTRLRESIFTSLCF